MLHTVFCFANKMCANVQYVKDEVHSITAATVCGITNLIQCGTMANANSLQKSKGQHVFPWSHFPSCRKAAFRNFPKLTTGLIVVPPWTSSPSSFSHVPPAATVSSKVFLNWSVGQGLHLYIRRNIEQRYLIYVLMTIHDLTGLLSDSSPHWVRPKRIYIKSNKCLCLITWYWH